MSDSTDEIRKAHHEIVDLGTVTIQHATEVEWTEDDGWLHVKVKPGINVKGWAFTYDGRDYPNESARAALVATFEGVRNYGFCPVCNGNRKDGHADDCALAVAYDETVEKRLADVEQVADEPNKALADEQRDHEHTRNALATEQRWSESLNTEVTYLKREVTELRGYLGDRAMGRPVDFEHLENPQAVGNGGRRVTRTGTLGTPLRLSADTVPEMIRNRNGSPVAKAVSVDVALTLVEYANERDAMRAALTSIAEKARWYAGLDCRLAHEVDHALCVEILALAEETL